MARGRKIRKRRRPRRKRDSVKRKLWTNEAMVAAMEAVKTGTVSINKAAVMHGVPRTTLKDRISGRVTHGTKPGPSQYLSVEEENELADHLVATAKLGYGKTRKQVLSIAEQVAKEKQLLRKSRISNGWWRRFTERHPELSLRKGDPTAQIRMNATNKKALKEYYDLLEKTLKDNDLTNRPAQVYNMDETGVPLDPRPPNVVTSCGQKKVRYRVSGKKEQITVLGCGNAIGQSIPPMVIFEGKYLNYEWTKGEVPGTYYGMSGKGWTDQELFHHWLKDHFLKNAVQARPLLLLLDGHSSHFEPSSIELARENDVIIFCLPPHTTQDSQPLDTSVFGPLKRHWSDVCHQQLQKEPGLVITKYNFSELFAQAWLRALTPANIISGFRKCGIYPFNRNAIMVLDEDESSSAVQEACVERQTSDQTMEVDENPAEVEADLGFSSSSFTEDEIARFERRFEEGYDLYDPQYSRWLKIYHPSSAATMVSMPTTSECIADVFTDVMPLHPLRSEDNEFYVATNSIEQEDECSPPLNSTISSPTQLPPPSSPLSRNPLQDVTNNQGGSTPQQQRPLNKNVSPVSKYLQTPNSTPVSISRKPQSSRSRAVGGARVMTSDGCLAIIREREQNKKQEEEEKEARKKVREEKKKQRAEEKQRKAEVRAKKEEERLEKARQKAQKQQEKSRKAAQKHQVSTSSLQPTSSEPSTSSSGTRQLRSRQATVDPTIVSDVCCVCEQSFAEDIELGGGVEWLQCCCSRWLHEDCVIDTSMCSNGQVKLCPFC